MALVELHREHLAEPRAKSNKSEGLKRSFLKKLLAFHEPFKSSDRLNINFEDWFSSGKVFLHCGCLKHMYRRFSWLNLTQSPIKIKARSHRESFHTENIVKNVLLKKGSFLLRRGASTKKDSVLSYTHNSECFLDVMGESRGRRSHHHRSLASCSETFTPCPVHGNKRSHCGNGHNRSSPAVSHRIQFRHEAGRETWLLRAIISSRCNAVTRIYRGRKQWRCHKRDAEGHTRAENIVATCSLVVILEVGNSI